MLNLGNPKTRKLCAELGINSDRLGAVLSLQSPAMAKARMVELKKQVRERFHEVSLTHHPDRTSDETKRRHFSELSNVYNEFMECEITLRPQRPVMQAAPFRVVVVRSGGFTSTGTNSTTWNGTGDPFGF